MSVSIRMLFVIALSAMWSAPALATPAFARKQNVPCPVCHTAFPELNATGRAFKENGYRFPTAKGGVTTAGQNVGKGIILDKAPGIAVRVVSQIVDMGAGLNGEEPGTVATSSANKIQFATTPLDSVEVIMAGANGNHFSYLAELGAEQGDDYAVGGNAVAQFRFDQHATVFAGWTPLFSRDIYNSLNEARRQDHVDHAAQDYLGSTGIDMSTEGGLMGVYGRFGPMFYLAETGPGPDISSSITDIGMEPFDYAGRLAFDITKKVEVGGFVYYGATNTTNDAGNIVKLSTVRPALDMNAYSGFGTWKALAMYDTADKAVTAEVGWDDPITLKKVWLLPMARVDTTVVPNNSANTADAGTTSVVPSIGFGVEQSAGRLQLELSEPLGSDGVGTPSAQLLADIVF